MRIRTLGRASPSRHQTAGRRAHHMITARRLAPLGMPSHEPDVAIVAVTPVGPLTRPMTGEQDRCRPGRRDGADPPASGPLRPSFGPARTALPRPAVWVLGLATGPLDLAPPLGTQTRSDQRPSAWTLVSAVAATTPQTPFRRRPRPSRLLTGSGQQGRHPGRHPSGHASTRRQARGVTPGPSRESGNFPEGSPPLPLQADQRKRLNQGLQGAQDPAPATPPKPSKTRSSDPARSLPPRPEHDLGRPRHRRTAQDHEQLRTRSRTPCPRTHPRKINRNSRDQHEAVRIVVYPAHDLGLTLLSCCATFAGPVVVMLRGRPPQTPRCGRSRRSAVVPVLMSSGPGRSGLSPVPVR